MILVAGLLSCSQMYAENPSGEGMSEIWAKNRYDYIGRPIEYGSQMSMNAERTDYRERFEGYHFDGTKELDGKIYSVFRDCFNQPAAYLREEGKKIYRHNDESIQIINPSLQDSEFLLYDFGAQSGDTLSVYGFSFGSMMFYKVQIEVLACDTIEIEAKNGTKLQRIRHKAKWDGADLELTVIEGMGFDRGLLHYPQWHVAVISDATSLYTYSPEKVDWYTNHASGEFFLKDFYKEAVNAGVSTTESDNNPDSPVYDLMGREIKDPAPGTVYIQGGRKLIAR